MHQVQFVAITFDDGTLGVMQFVLDPNIPEGTTLPGWDGTTRESSDEAIQYEIDKSSFVATPVSWRRMDPSEIPQDRVFRNAWEDTGKVGVNMAKARDIHRDNLRIMREPLLAALDTEYMRADETGDRAAKVAVAAQKQALRDVTADPRIEAAQTPEELKAVIPDALKV